MPRMLSMLFDAAPRYVLLGVLFAAFCAAAHGQDDGTATAESALAHRILDAGVQTNALATQSAAPWRLKAEFRIYHFGAPHPIVGTMEEWFAGPDRWRRTYASAESGLSGTEWSVGPHQRVLARRGAASLDRIRLAMRIARPLTEPLARAALLRPDAPLELKIISSGGVTLNCISVLRAAHDTAAPYPGMCFDRANRLRLLSTLSAAVEFDKYADFRHRAVARSLKVLVGGRLFAEIDLTALEPLPASDLPLLEPPRHAIPEPELLEPGAPAPVSIFETAAHPPLQPDGYPYRATVLAVVVLDKSGRARVDRGLSVSPGVPLLDSVEIAVHRWRFKPYLLDGHPAEVAFIARYAMDGKPFTPLFQQRRTIEASELEEYLEAGGGFDGIALGAQRPHRGRR